ncbi:MAG: hypothetical protein ACJAXB_002754 [Candidatus Endobugula sp.]|jgi:hypothetical protein
MKKMKYSLLFVLLIVFGSASASFRVIDESSNLINDYETALFEAYSECLTCLTLEDYQRLQEGIKTVPWFKQQIINRNSSERRDLFTSWKVLTKSGVVDELADAHEDIIIRLATDLRQNRPGFRSYLNPYSTDPGVTLEVFANRGRAWEVLASSSDDAIKALRTNTERLEDLSNYLASNPGRIDIVRSELNAAANPEQYLDFVKFSGTDFGGFYDAFKLYGYGQNDRSWAWYINNLNSKNNLRVGLDGFDGMSWEEVIEQVLQSGPYSHMNKSDAYYSFAYTTGYYYRVTNEWLLRGLNPGLRIPIVNAATESLSKLPRFPSNTTFYRAIGLEGDDLQDFLTRYTQGAVVPEPHFQSVATRREDTFIGGQGKNIELTIIGRPTGDSRCRNIHDFAMFKYVNQPDRRTLTEGVFLPNTSMRVREIHLPANGDGIYRLVLEEI